LYGDVLDIYASLLKILSKKIPANYGDTKVTENVLPLQTKNYKPFNFVARKSSSQAAHMIQ